MKSNEFCIAEQLQLCGMKHAIITELISRYTYDCHEIGAFEYHCNDC